MSQLGFWMEGNYADMTIVQIGDDPTRQFSRGQWSAIVEDSEHIHWPVPLETRGQLRAMADVLETTFDIEVR